MIKMWMNWCEDPWPLPIRNKCVMLQEGQRMGPNNWLQPASLPIQLRALEPMRCLWYAQRC